MKKLLFILFILLCQTDLALAYRVAVVKSSDAAPYQEVALAVEAAFRQDVPQRGIRMTELHQFMEVLVNEEMQGERLNVSLRNAGTDLVITIGRKALAACSHINKIPIIYTLVVQTEDLVKGRSNITGITLDVPPSLFFTEVKHLLPAVKRVGVLYGPASSEELINQAIRDVPSLQFVPRRITKATNANSQLEDMGQVDVLWMIPDPVVASKAGLKDLFLHSFKYKIPVASFSPQFLKPGAAIVVAPNLEEIGFKAARYASKILSGTPPSDLPPEPANKALVLVNQTIARKLKLSLDGDTP